jgi:uncharacterized protein YigE (DUF2233 family)
MLLATLAAALLVAEPAPASAASGWRTLEPGLEYGLFDGPPGAPGDGKIAVARLDPEVFELHLLNASAPGQGAPLSARAWADRAGASAIINASMYQPDYKTAVSLMRTRDHVNQGHVTRDRAALVFDRLDRSLPPVRIVDRDCDDLDAARKKYGTVVQSIRMLSCEGKNVWAPSERRTSVAAVGIDGKGRVLFLHARSAWPVHELVAALLALPLDLRRAMYVEGGPEAQLFVRGGGAELERLGVGPAETGAWPVPNVIAAVRRRR